MFIPNPCRCAKKAQSLTCAINGCLFKVHNALGNIWTEEVYEKALESELSSQGLAVQRQKEFEVFYFDKQSADTGRIFWSRTR